MHKLTVWRSLVRGRCVPCWAVVAALMTLAGAAMPVGAQAVDLAPTGRLRVAVDATNTALATKDPASGEWQGIYIDLSRALAQRLGVPIAFVEYASIVERDASAAAGVWDITSDSRLPEEAAALGWAAAIPYLDTDNTLVVGPNSSIHSIADMDRPGIRIGALSGTGPERNLSGLVKQAEVVRTATVAELVPLLRSGQVDALVSNRSIVLAFAAQVPGSRVLADRYAVTQQRLMLAPGHSAASLTLASDVTRQALASGLIRSAIERYSVVGVQPATVAPGGLPRTGGPPMHLARVVVTGLVAAAAGLSLLSRPGRRAGAAPARPRSPRGKPSATPRRPPSTGASPPPMPALSSSMSTPQLALDRALAR